MKKFINSVENLLDESLQGFALAHADIVRFNPAPRYLARMAPRQQGKVALISGGGSGHEPLHSGFVAVGGLGDFVVLWWASKIFTASKFGRVLLSARPCGWGSQLRSRRCHRCLHPLPLTALIIELIRNTIAIFDSRILLRTLGCSGLSSRRRC